MVKSLLVECHFHHGNSGFDVTYTSCITCYQAKQTFSNCFWPNMWIVFLRFSLLCLFCSHSHSTASANFNQSINPHSTISYLQHQTKKKKKTLFLSLSYDTDVYWSVTSPYSFFTIITDDSGLQIKLSHSSVFLLSLRENRLTSRSPKIH
jgi:hypothetical protein